MTTARHGSAHLDRSPHRGRLAAGIAVLAVAALPLLLLVWLLFDYATQEYVGSEAGFTRFAMLVVAMVTLQLVSSGVALIRSGRAGQSISRIYLFGLGVLVVGFGGTYVVNHTVEGAEYVEAFYALSLIVGTVAMAFGAFLPPFRRPTSIDG
jgi:hypothetical protein